MLTVTLHEELRPFVASIVAEVLAQRAEDEIRAGDVIALDEHAAARLIGVESHVLRDARLRGDIRASRITGRRIRYLKADLLEYLARTRIDAGAMT